MTYLLDNRSDLSAILLLERIESIVVQQPSFVFAFKENTHQKEHI